MTVRPGDWTQLDIARAIAREALAELRKRDPQCYEKLVRIATAKPLCQGWVAPPPGEVPRGERVTDHQASAETGVPASTIRAWASDPRVPVWRQYGGYDLQEIHAVLASKRLQDEDRAELAKELAKRYNAGETIAEIAEDIGRSEHYVVTLLREADVVLRRRGHR